MEQAIQLSGALLILVAYIAGQRGWLRPDAVSYLVLNLVGATILAADAWWGRQWGFFLLESVWAIISLSSLITTLRSLRRPSLP